jgi:hypothetical protein
MPLKSRYAYIENRAAKGCDISRIILTTLQTIAFISSKEHIIDINERQFEEPGLSFTVERQISSEGTVKWQLEQWQVYTREEGMSP